MSFEQWVGLGSSLISFIGLLLVVIQLRANAFVHLSDISRELLTLSFEYPELRKVLSDEQVEPDMERTYLQMWINHFGLVHSQMRKGFYARSLKKRLEDDIAEFMEMENAQRHWESFGKHYPASFQKFVKKIIAEAGKRRSEATSSAPVAQSSRKLHEAS